MEKQTSISVKVYGFKSVQKNTRLIKHSFGVCDGIKFAAYENTTESNWHIFGNWSEDQKERISNEIKHQASKMSYRLNWKPKPISHF